MVVLMTGVKQLSLTTKGQADGRRIHDYGACG